ncbi:MAG: alpha/beta fold hydrolase [Gemmatimonadaceae bacterium]|nr:alpha/beta fold hydrolase [Gemmatimonadaceae bacterium]
MTPARALFLALFLSLSALALVRSRNPERQDMDAAARAAAPGAFFSLGDGSTHYRLDGPDSGARVLLAHGFSVPSYIWDSTATALAGAGFRVARYDYYGRGWSDRPDIAYDPDLYDRQLSQVLDSLGWTEPVHLMGLSFGGPVTAAFTARHPERVRSLTLVDPAAGQGGDVPWYFRLPAVGPVLWQGLAVPTMADGQRSDFVEPAGWPDWPDRYRQQLQYKGFGRALLRTLRATAGVSRDSIFAGVGRVKTPTLLIWGHEDQTVPIALANGVRAAIPQVEFHAIDRAGHLPHMERTDVVNPLLITFLRAHTPAITDSATTPIR